MRVKLFLIICLFYRALTALEAGSIGPLESFPPEIQAAIERRDRVVRRLSRQETITPYYVLSISQRWVPSGQQTTAVITVAFKGGNQDLRKAIATVASEWMQYANVSFDFMDPVTHSFREWTEADTSYKADIRISFDKKGYWSVVGKDSIDPSIVKPNEASMNFFGFTNGIPDDLSTTVQHEFGHVLGLTHEHQAPIGGCDQDWRWDDDPGYQPTMDGNGAYIRDRFGRYPGIYSVLGSYPNFWPKNQVDTNMRQLNNDSHAFDQSPFDLNSIMKYYFPASMFKDGLRSHCYSGRNLKISAQDRTGVAKWYPRAPALLLVLRKKQASAYRSLLKIDVLPETAKRHYSFQLNLLR